MKTYKIILLALMSAFTLTMCTPKTTEAVTMVEDEVQEVVEEMKDPALAWRSKAPGAGPARKIQLGEYNTFTLDNGLEVIVVENNKLPRVSYSMTLKNNPLIEGQQAGYVDIAGDMLSRGTKTRSKADIDAEVDFIGAQLSSYSGGVFASSLTKHKEALLELATDVLYNPVFDEEEFEKLRTQYLSGIQTEKSDPNSMAANVAKVINYGPSHPYGQVRTESTLQNVKLKSCKEYYNDYFKPNNAYLTIVGDVTAAEAKADAEKYFGSWSKGEVPTNNYGMPPSPVETNVAFVNKEAAVQSVINITYPVDLKPGSDDAIAASLMNSILGGGIFSGRLMQNLREDKAFTYGARSRLSTDKLVGEFVAFASVRNEVTDSSVTEFIYELERMITEEVNEEDLQLAKNSNAGAFARSLESPQTLARYALNIVKYDLPKDYYETYLEKLEAVSVADITAMAKKYIRPNNANIVIVGNKDEVADKLKKFDDNGEIDYYDAFGNKVEIVESVPTDVTPSEILDKYIAAIAPSSKMEDIKTLHQIYTMSVQGQDMEVNMYFKDNKKLAMQMKGMGMTLMDQRYDGMKVQTSGMGQETQVMEEGPMVDQLKNQAKIIEQRYYVEEGFELELKGVEEIDGQQVYKLGVVSPNGEKSTEFYSVENGYLIRTVKVDAESGKAIMVTLSDYQEKGGYMFPMKISTEGAAPFVMEMIGKETNINPELSDDIFSIE